MMTQTKFKPDAKPMRQPNIETDLSDEPAQTRNFQASRRMQRNENDLISNEDDPINKPEALNTRALTVINRVSNKLTGRDFKSNQTLDVRNQVQRLILQATSLENLCQCYIGWCAFW